LRRRHSGLHARDREVRLVEIIVDGEIFGGERERRPEIGLLRPLKIGRHHSDDGVWLPVELDRAAND
jgi:hypothetical protein